MLSCGGGSMCCVLSPVPALSHLTLTVITMAVFKGQMRQ